MPPDYFTRTLNLGSPSASREFAHGDRDDLLRWLDHFQHPPKQVFLTHGEKEDALSLALAIEQRYNYKATVPTYQEVVEL